MLIYKVMFTKKYFIYRNKNTNLYFTHKGQDSNNINAAYKFHPNSFLFITNISSIVNNSVLKSTLINSDDFNRRNEDYIRINFDDELVAMRKEKLKKLYDTDTRNDR